MENISGYGIKVQVVATVTFPLGITITEFADDSDPLDMPSQEIAGAAMGVNGDLIVWDKATQVLATITVIPGSQDDINLSILFQANRVFKGKPSSKDIISMSVIYPDETIATLSTGKLLGGMPGKSVASEGRQKTKAYIFAFEKEVSN